MTVAVTGKSGFAGSVSVSIQGLPQGVSSSPASPFSVSAGTSQGVTFSASTSATAGNVTITFSGTSGALAHTVPASLTVTEPTFAMSANVSSLSLCVGCSQSLQVSVSAGSPNDMVNLSAVISGSQQRNVSATFSPATISPGGNATLTVSTATAAAPFSSLGIALTGTRTSDNTTQSINLPLQIVIGGGTLKIVPRTSGQFAIPASAVPYITNFFAKLIPVVADQCGPASDARTTELILNPADAGHTYFESGVNGSNHLIHLGGLPNPGSNGQDPNWNHPAAHETGNAHHGLWIALISGKGSFNTTDEMDVDPDAEVCAVSALRALVQAGTVPADPNYLGQPLSILDTLARYKDPMALAGNRYLPGYSPFQIAGEGFYKLLIGPKGFPTFAAYEEALFTAMNENGGLLSPAAFQSFLNQAVIDSEGAGDWCMSRFPVFFGMPASASGTGFIAWTITPNNPFALTAQAFVESITNGDSSATPIASGKVVLGVTNTTGAQVASFTTDLANTSAMENPFVMNLQNTLATGVYNLLVSATANGQTLMSEMPIIVPSSTFNGSLPNAPGIYGILVDGNGNAMGGSLAVSEGTVVNSGNGFAIIEVGASGEATVNGRRFTAPQIGSRVVFVPAP